MLNFIWLGMMCLAVLVGLIQGHLNDVVLAITSSAKVAFELALGLSGIMALWLGIMNIATESGLMNHLAKALRPIMIRLFPDVPVDHPAMGAMVLNFSANMLGLNNAATPFGLAAMKELQSLNTQVNEASNAMCMFLAINTSSVQLIPATAIAFLAANGCSDPTSIITSSLIATSISTIVAIITVKRFEKLPRFRIREAV